MKSNPLGAIFSADMQYPNQKYATSVLESMSTLETTQNIFLKQNNQYINQTLVTNQFRTILNSIYTSSNPSPAMDLIGNLNKYAMNYNQDLNQFNSPYTFLYYLLQMLDQEYNGVFQIQINLNQEFPNLQNAVSFLEQLYGSPNTSIILKNYCFSLIMSNVCNSCNFTKLKPVIKKTIDLNIDSYKQLNNGNPLSLNDCLNYYFSIKKIQANCQNCHQTNFIQSRIIQKSGPVLIINLMRDNYTGEKDPNFNIDLNLDISNYKQDKTDGNNYYTLKSCISYSNYGFFSDCYVKRENMLGSWYRYMDKQQVESNQNILFNFQPILLFYEVSNNQNNNNNMNINIGQNMNYNNQNDMQNININRNINISGQNNKINENDFDIISNFPLNLKIAIENEFHNFDFNFDSDDNNQQSNFQINSNFDNNPNQINNNFDNISSQEKNQFNQINQNNNEMNMNNIINNQNLNNNNFNQNIEQINQNIEQINKNNDQNTDNNESKDKNLNNELNENTLNPFFVPNKNNDQNVNANSGNNDENLNLNNPNNSNQNQINEINKNLNPNLNNDINSELNKNIIPGLNNFNIIDSPIQNPNNFQNIDMQQNQPNIINQNQNQNLQFNQQDNNQIPKNENLNEQFNNEMFNNFQQNKNIIPNINENMNLNKQENKQIQPDLQQNNFLQNNIIQNDVYNNMNIHEEKKLEIPQMQMINNAQNQIKNHFIPQMNNPPQQIQNLNQDNKNIINNEISQQKIQPANVPINPNFNIINQMPQMNIPQNIPLKVKEEKVKKEEPYLIKKEMPKPEPKNEIKNEMPKLEPKKEIKKEEKKKEEIKPNKDFKRKPSMQERIKLMSGGIKLNQPPQAAAPKKRFSQDTQPKNEPKKEETKPKQMEFGGGKKNQMNQFKAMLEKKGGFGAPRPSGQIMGMPHGFGMMMNKDNDKGGQEVKINKEEKLEDTLDKINVQKKKKKSKIVFNDDNQ